MRDAVQELRQALGRAVRTSTTDVASESAHRGRLDANEGPAMTKTLITTALALGLGRFTAPASTEPSGQKCYYVLDVLLCD